MFATWEIVKVACEVLVFVVVDVVIITTGLGFDLVVVFIATPHVENKVDIFVFVLGKELRELGAYIVIGSANGRFVHDKIDSSDDGSIWAWGDDARKRTRDLVGCVYGELAEWLVVVLVNRSRNL